MNYSYPMSPYIQTNMAQAVQAILTGGPLPPGCVILAMPIQQAQQVLPQLMMNTAVGGNAFLMSQPLSHYGQMYQPQISYYPNSVPSTALVPYTNYYSQGYNPNTNYPLVPYEPGAIKSKEKDYHGRNYPLQPHSNVYNSSSFDTQMENLSWSRLFGHHHHRRHRHTSKQPKPHQQAISYEPKDDKSKSKSKSQPPKQGTSIKSSSLLSSSSSSTTDESIRRVSVPSKPSTGLPTSQQPTKGTLPFKYSSECIPGSVKQASEKVSKKDTKVRSDDVFIVKKTQSTETPKKK